MVPEGTPHRVVAVDRDRVADPQVPHGPADVVNVVLERELRCVRADHHQPLAGVFPGPGAEVGKLAEPVDAGKGPEVDQDHVPAQACWRQRRRIEPPGRAAERRQVTLDGQPGRGRVQPAGRGPGCCHDNATLARAGPGIGGGTVAGPFRWMPGRLAAGLDEVPDRGPAVAAPPGYREPGWFKAADRDADDPLARIDVGVARGQQRYCRAGRDDLKFLVGGTHLGGHPRRLARPRVDGQPEIALCARRGGQRGYRLVDDLGEFDGLAVCQRVAGADRDEPPLGCEYFGLDLGGVNGQPHERGVGRAVPQARCLVAPSVGMQLHLPARLPLGELVGDRGVQRPPDRGQRADPQHPRAWAAASLTTATPSSQSWSRLRATACSAVPAAVSSTWRRSRRNSWARSDVSRPRICLLRAGCDRCRRSAAG